MDMDKPSFKVPKMAWNSVSTSVEQLLLDFICHYPVYISNYYRVCLYAGYWLVHLKTLNPTAMTPHHFDSLTKGQQADLLQFESVFLYSRQEPEFTVDLYLVHDFYVEVYYHKDEEEFIILRSFYADTQLQPYLPDHKIRYMTYYSYSIPSA